MLEHTGHGSCMWRSTGLGAGGNKMIRVHGSLLLDVKTLALEQERIKCWSTEDMAHSCGEALQ